MTAPLDLSILTICAIIIPLKAFYQSSLLSLQSREVQWFVAYERPVSALIVYVSVGSCDQREIPMNQLF